MTTQWQNTGLGTPAGSAGLIRGTIGDAITAAATITITDPIHVVTGSATITTINGGKEGAWYSLIAGAGSTWSLATGGNIASGQQSTPSRRLDLLYDGTTWYPHAVGVDQADLPYFDVTLAPYNATGDGSTDDAAAIQAAVDAAEVSGGIVFFPQGRYVISSQITVAASNVVLQGCGWASVIISKVLTAVPAVYRSDAVSAWRGVVVRDLRITGEWTDGAAVNGGSSETALLWINEGLEALVENVKCDYGANAGLVLAGCEAAKVRDCSLRDNTTWGARVIVSEDAGASGPLVKFLDNMIKNNTTGGVDVVNASSHVFKHNVIEANGIGLYIKVTDVTIDNNKFESNTVASVRVGDGTSRGTCNINRCKFSNDNLDFLTYANCIVADNAFTASATVTMGSDEGNKYSFFARNLIAESQITPNTDVDGKWTFIDNYGTTKDLQVTFADGDETPSVMLANAFRTLNTGATSITTFDNGYTGKTIAIITADDLTTLVNGATGVGINTSTGADIKLAAGDMILLQAFASIADTSIPVWRDVGYWPNTWKGSPSAKIFSSVTEAGYDGITGGAQVLILYPLPAKALHEDGAGVRITAWGTTANNSNPKTIKLEFGGAIITTALTVSQAGTWRIVAEVVRSASNAQDYVAQLTQGGATTIVDVEVGSLTRTDTSVINIFCRGTVTDGGGGINDDDIVQEGMIVEMLR